MTGLGRVVRGVLATGWATAAAIAVAVPARADPDIDFANQLHGFGIYGPRDYNAWLGKITCKRLDRGVDGDAYASINFISRNLDRGTTQETGREVPRRGHHHLLRIWGIALAAIRRFDGAAAICGGGRGLTAAGSLSSARSAAASSAGCSDLTGSLLLRRVPRRHRRLALT